MPSHNESNGLTPNPKASQPVGTPRTNRLAQLSPPTKPAEAAPPTVHLRVRVITPLYGCGPRPREGDRHTPVRPASVRGQLRFWWRATAGAAFGADIESLRRAEAKLWGGVAISGIVEERPEERASLASRVSVSVTAVGKPGQISPRTVSVSDENGFGMATPRGYALFPGREQTGDNFQPAAQVTEGLCFDLRLGLPEDASLQAQVLDATRAWLLFGGIGGRTRRGAGALALEAVTSTEGEIGVPGVGELAPFWYPVEADSKKLSLRAWLSEVFPSDAPSSAPAWPVLPGSEVRWSSSRPVEEAEKAWLDGIRAIRTFRQHPRVYQGRTNYAASSWPEAKAIRHLAGTLPSPSGGPKPVYPRGSLGLPVIFHFAMKAKGERYAPDTHTLTWREPGGDDKDDKRKVRDRMASPIIVKPMAIGPERYVSIALRLNVALPEGDLVLLDRSKNPVRRSRVGFDAPIPDLYGPVAPLRAHGSALDAFMESFTSDPRKTVVLGGAR